MIAKPPPPPPPPTAKEFDPRTEMVWVDRNTLDADLLRRAASRRCDAQLIDQTVVTLVGWPAELRSAHVMANGRHHKPLKTNIVAVRIPAAWVLNQVRHQFNHRRVNVR